MLLNTEHPSWLAFPDVPQWSSHAPKLEVSFSVEHLPPQVLAAYHTESLAEAVRKLMVPGDMQFVYWVFPHARDGSPATHSCSHVLDASVMNPLTPQPSVVSSCEDSGLWSTERQRHAIFALRPQPEFRSIRLCVGGNSQEECLNTWHTVAEWIRTLVRIQFYKSRIQTCKPVAERDVVPSCLARAKKLLRQQVREALQRASEIEAKAGPFRLRDRGHEPRVSLDPSLAAIVRSIELPSVRISGFGPNFFYPLRVFARAADELERAHGRKVLGVRETRAWINDVLVCTQRGCGCKKRKGAA